MNLPSTAPFKTWKDASKQFDKIMEKWMASDDNKTLMAFITLRLSQDMTFFQLRLNATAGKK